MGPGHPRGRNKAPSARDRAAVVAVEAGKSLGSAARTERMLTRAEVEEFRQMLIAKRAEILGDVSTLHNEALNKDRRDAAGDLSSMPIHMADLGSDNYELEFTLGLIEGERASSAQLAHVARWRSTSALESEASVPST